MLILCYLTKLDYFVFLPYPPNFFSLPFFYRFHEVSNITANYYKLYLFTMSQLSIVQIIEIKINAMFILRTKITRLADGLECKILKK